MFGVGGVGGCGVFGCGGCGACWRERLALLSLRPSMRTKLAIATGSRSTLLRGGLTMLCKHQREQQQRHYAGGDEGQHHAHQRCHHCASVLAARATSCTPAWRAWSITWTTSPVRAS
ncbi:hypothetical protein SSTU70S_00278 [Stutzerimonas stutzeri]